MKNVPVENVHWAFYIIRIFNDFEVLTEKSVSRVL